MPTLYHLYLFLVLLLRPRYLLLAFSPEFVLPAFQLIFLGFFKLIGCLQNLLLQLLNSVFMLPQLFLQHVLFLVKSLIQFHLPSCGFFDVVLNWLNFVLADGNAVEHEISLVGLVFNEDIFAIPGDNLLLLRYSLVDFLPFGAGPFV